MPNVRGRLAAATEPVGRRQELCRQRVALFGGPRRRRRRVGRNTGGWQQQRRATSRSASCCQEGACMSTATTTAACTRARAARALYIWLVTGNKEDTPGRASLERPRTREPTTMPVPSRRVGLPSTNQVAQLRRGTRRGAHGYAARTMEPARLRRCAGDAATAMARPSWMHIP